MSALSPSLGAKLFPQSKMFHNHVKDICVVV